MFSEEVDAGSVRSEIFQNVNLTTLSCYPPSKLSNRTVYLFVLLVTLVTVTIVQFWDDKDVMVECNTISCVSGNELWQGYVFMAVIISIYSLDLLQQFPPQQMNLLILLLYFCLVLFNLVAFLPTTYNYCICETVHMVAVFACLAITSLILILWSCNRLSGYLRQSRTRVGRTCFTIFLAVALIVSNKVTEGKKSKTGNAVAIYVELAALMQLRSNFECLIRKLHHPAGVTRPRKLECSQL